MEIIFDLLPLLDLILVLAWIGLSFSGILFQYLRERNRPPFSPPAEMWRRTGHVAEQTALLGSNQPTGGYGANL